MDTDKNTTPAAGADMESKDDTDSFTKVKSKKTQKRKREQDGVDMDTEEPVASKRPQFPPISADKLKVNTICVHVGSLLSKRNANKCLFNGICRRLKVASPLTALRLRNMLL